MISPLRNVTYERHVTTGESPYSKKSGGEIVGVRRGHDGLKYPSFMSLAAPNERRTHIRFLLCFWLFVLSAISYLDRTNIVIAGPQLMQQFGLDNQRLGWISSAFLIGYASFQFPAGVLAVRFGPRRVLTGGVFVWVACNICTALLPSGISRAILLLMSVRCALGIAE